LKNSVLFSAHCIERISYDFQNKQRTLTRLWKLFAGFLSETRVLMPGKFMLGLWCTKWHWALFSSNPPTPLLFWVSHFSIIPPVLRVHLLLSRRCFFISEIDSLGKVRLQTLNSECLPIFLFFGRTHCLHFQVKIFTLDVEALRYSKASVDVYQNTRSHIPEEGNFYTRGN